MPQKSNKIKGPVILEAIRFEQGEDEKGTFFFSDACITGHPLRGRALAAGYHASQRARSHVPARGRPQRNPQSRISPFLFALDTPFPRSSRLFTSAIPELRGGNLLH